MDTVVLVEVDGMRCRSRHFFVAGIDLQSLERSVTLELGLGTGFETSLSEACTGRLVAVDTAAKDTCRLGKNESSSVEAEGATAQSNFVWVRFSRCFSAAWDAIVLIASLFGGAESTLDTTGLGPETPRVVVSFTSLLVSLSAGFVGDLDRVAVGCIVMPLSVD